MINNRAVYIFRIVHTLKQWVRSEWTCTNSFHCNLVVLFSAVIVVVNFTYSSILILFSWKQRSTFTCTLTPIYVCKMFAIFSKKSQTLTFQTMIIFVIKIVRGFLRNRIDVYEHQLSSESPETDREALISSNSANTKSNILYQHRHNG